METTGHIYILLLRQIDRQTLVVACTFDESDSSASFSDDCVIFFEFLQELCIFSLRIFTNIQEHNDDKPNGGFPKIKEDLYLKN